MIKQKSQIKGMIFLLLAALFWGSAFIAQKIASKYPFATNTFRFLLGGLILIPVAIIYNKLRKNSYESAMQQKAETKRSIKCGVICGISLAFATSLQQLGLSLGTSAGKSGFLSALYIIFIPIFSLFIGKKTTWFVWLSVIIAFAGTFLISFSSASDFCVGDVITIFCAMCFAINVMVVGHFSSGTNPIVLSVAQCFSAGILSGVFLIISLILKFEAFSLESIRAIALPVLYIAVFSCCVAYTCQIIGQRYTAPAPASIIMSLESVVSLIFGIIFLKETISLTVFIGILLVFIATIISQLDGFLVKKNT